MFSLLVDRASYAAEPLVAYRKSRSKVAYQGSRFRARSIAHLYLRVMELLAQFFTSSKDIEHNETSNEVGDQISSIETRYV